MALADLSPPWLAALALGSAICLWSGVRGLIAVADGRHGLARRFRADVQSISRFRLLFVVFHPRGQRSAICLHGAPGASVTQARAPRQARELR